MKIMKKNFKAVFERKKTTFLSENFRATCIGQYVISVYFLWKEDYVKKGKSEVTDSCP